VAARGVERRPARCTCSNQSLTLELTLRTPAGLVPEMGGPRVYGLADLIRGYLRARGKRRMMVPVWIPGKAARALRAGANLAAERAVGHRTCEDFLVERVNSPSLGEQTRKVE